MVLGIVQGMSGGMTPRNMPDSPLGPLGVALWEWGQATGRLAS